MNYDPIHDTFVKTDSNGDSSSNKGESQIGEGDKSEGNRGISIDNLVDTSNNVPINHNSEETEHENEIDHDLTAVNSSEIEIDSAGKDKNKKAMKGKRAQSNSLKGFRHLKKSDGEPFWRKDIQYDFLQELFNDETKAFTNFFPHSDIPSAVNETKLTFSQLYVRNLAESGKCSRILKERLLKDLEMGKSVGKVCLLVNAGRMNTTVNFVPEMRSSLRTYHSIPSLQADPVYGGSKPLQDTPRLKSILKAVTEVHGEIKSLDDLLEYPPVEKPNTNIVQLLFFLSNCMKKIKFLQDDTDSADDGNEFIDFFLNSRIYPKNRSQRFLWLIYTYLETSFTPEELANNPFNPHTIPPVEFIPESEINDFDKDTDYEIEFSERMYQTRLKYVADEEHNSNPKRGNKSKKERESFEGDDNQNPDEDSTQISQDSVTEYPSKKRKTIADLKSKKRKGKGKPAGSHIQNNTMLNDSPDTTIDDIPQKPVNINNEDGVPSSQITAPIDPSVHLNNEQTDNSIRNMEDSNPYYITFPIEDLESIVKAFANSIGSQHSPESSTSLTARQNVVAKSKPFIKQFMTSNKITSEEYTGKVDRLVDWLEKYFQYKKSSANSLLGIEWEAIRYDLVNGIESYIYQSLGNYLNSKLMSSAKEKDRGTNSNPGGTFEIENFEDVGFGYLPIHDFNRYNEKNSYICDLLAFCNDYVMKKQSEVARPTSKIRYDLDKEEVIFT
ncbi:Piso0_000327 [Millerozyma farinosa CBS 7064]|uniref:Piso0_000327 protein n=1 Tax=Pichia sorbitophila (strain ATCC MYA-4447 / BCRC 22081 / CBS 7064 / NBRC 10061 / NRRL Y-12695) TaxID=559304 RepID=G8YTP3_PICSO|nr:Piso0_000327 [Millerozyma farinosa CBS 7064]CCE73294.1 Piso0_000327 [Millerozyma farinosa CBS 7064]